MPVFRTDRNQTFDKDGNLLNEEVVDIDVTEEAVEYDLHEQARAAIVANKAYLASTPSNAEVLAQVDTLTSQVNKIIKLLVKDFTEEE